MWLVGRATEVEVTRYNDALLGSVYRELRLRVGTAGFWLTQRKLRIGFNGNIDDCRQG